MNQFHIFETAIGWAGVAWGDMADGSRGLIAAHLPEADPAIARKSFARRAPGAIEAEPPPEIADLIEGIRALMRGEKADLTSAQLDISRVPAFNARVYAIARAIPPGETKTYGEIAIQLGDRLLAQQVGAALGKNPWPIIVPCHRVTAAGGKLGGFSARGGSDTKLRLLEIEGAEAAALAKADQAKAALKAGKKAEPSKQPRLL
jgi:methylated-DNA-[protein]-cysteine S-methyltransferase